MCRRWPELFANTKILKGPSGTWRMSKFADEWSAAVHHGLGPHVLLHSLCWCHPWSTRFAPARGTCDRHLHPELIPESNRVSERVLPFRRHVSQPLLNDLRCLQRCIEILESHN